MTLSEGTAVSWSYLEWQQGGPGALWEALKYLVCAHPQLQYLCILVDREMNYIWESFPIICSTCVDKRPIIL